MSCELPVAAREQNGDIWQSVVGIACCCPRTEWGYLAKCRGNCLLLPASRVGIGGKVSWELPAGKVGIGGKVSWELPVAARDQSGNRWQSVNELPVGWPALS